MGLQIGELVPRKPIRLEELKDKVIAVDAFNALYQFLANIRQPDGTPLMDSKGRVTSHLNGLFYRTTHLLALGVKLVYVFDGKPAEQKKVLAIRSARKEEAKVKYEEAAAKEEKEVMYKLAKQFMSLTDEMVEESKALLDALGVPWVQAPSEGEAQCAAMTKRGDAWAVASQDYDALAFGASRLLQNLTFARRRRLPSGAWVPVAPELIELDKVLNSLQINLDQLICLSILVGTDFNPKGVIGLGPKRSLEIVRRYKKPVLIFQAIEKLVKEGKLPEPDFDWHEIFQLFKQPEIRKDYKTKFQPINENSVKQLLCKEHNFSAERVESALKKVLESKAKESQKQLKNWFY